MRHHALLVRRARWTNAVHSPSFVVCVGIFVHAQNCARSSTHECTRQKDASHAQSALDQRPTHAGHTRCTRWACVVCSSTGVQRTPSAPWAHIQRASNACPARRAFFWRVPSVCVACTQRESMGYINASLPITSSLLVRPSWVMTYLPDDSVSKNYLRRWMIPLVYEYNTKSRFSNISITSWNWDFTNSMSSGEEERKEVIRGSGSDRGSVGDYSVSCMTSYLWNSVMKTRHISRTSCGCPPRCSTSY